ncbi:MAG TPA: hypothetical protein PKY50_19215, partial [Candidatus Competibacter sp.]|nr:hypothetical protein [Candidatus Competibacter sp.]
MFANQIPQHGARRSGRHRPAVAQDQQLVGQAIGLVHVVGGQDNPQAIAPESVDQFPDLQARLRVQSGGRFVQEQQLWFVNQGAGEHKPAPVAAREYVRFGVRVAVQPEALQQRGHSCLQRGRTRAEVATHLLQVAAHRE